MRLVVALVSGGTAVGYAVSRIVRSGSPQSGGDPPSASLADRARGAPAKIRAVADLGMEQARQAVQGLQGSVRIVAAAPPEPDADD